MKQLLDDFKQQKVSRTINFSWSANTKKQENQSAFLSVGNLLAAAERLSSAALACISSLSLKYMSKAFGRNLGIKKANRFIEKYATLAIAIKSPPKPVPCNILHPPT